MSELRLNTDGHIIKFGADNDVSLTHVADTGLLLNSTMQLQFNDASQNINAPSATILDINATDEIELNATAVDLNGTLDVSGTLTQTGVATFTARDIHSSGITIANAGQIGSVGDADSMAIASNGVVTFTQAPVFPDGSLAVADLDIDGATDIGAAVVDADLFIIDDGAGGANRKVTASRIKTYAGGAAVMNDLTDVAMDITNFVDSIVIQTDSNGSAPTTGTLSGATGNVGIGKDVFKTLTSGTQNVVFGYQAGDAITTGADNIVLGAHAGTDLNTGTNNTFVGYQAGHTSIDSSNNIMIGYQALASATGTSEMVIGISVSGKGDDTGFLAPPGGASMFQSSNATTFQQTSDRRIKKNIVDNNDGLEQVKQIRVRNFEYRTEDEITDFENTKSTVVEKEGIQLGAIAQEIEEVFPDMVTTQSTGVKTVNTDNLTWYLVNAVQELSTQVGELQSELKALKG